MQYDYNNTSLNKPMAEINIVPYVDVMLVLLIIFMVTAPLLTQGVIVDLPESSAQILEEQEMPPIIVSVDAKGNYFLNIEQNPNTPMLPSALSKQVAIELEKTPHRPVLVRGDNLVDYGKVVTAMVLLQHAGAKSVGLVTDADETGVQ
ncbi:MAG: protein TolR [Legionellales bacterium]|jgi:biopolymer transport protein TolR